MSGDKSRRPDPMIHINITKEIEYITTSLFLRRLPYPFIIRFMCWSKDTVITALLAVHPLPPVMPPNQGFLIAFS